MIIRVEREMCSGHARCFTAQPEMFTLDEEGYSNAGTFEVPVGCETAARRAVTSCPEGAIFVEEE
jgi:ferredoxin